MVISFEIYLLIAAIPIIGIAAIGMFQEQAKFGYLHGQGRFVGTSMGFIVLLIGLSFFFGSNGYWFGVIFLWIAFIASILPGSKRARVPDPPFRPEVITPQDVKYYCGYCGNPVPSGYKFCPTNHGDVLGCLVMFGDAARGQGK